MTNKYKPKPETVTPSKPAKNKAAIPKPSDSVPATLPTKHSPQPSSDVLPFFWRSSKRTLHEAFKDFATQDFPIDRFYPVVKVNSQSSSEAILRATSSDSDAFYFPTPIPATAPVYNPTPLNLKDNKLQTYIWGPIACQIVWLGVNVTTPLCCITLVESILKNGVKYQIINLSILSCFIYIWCSSSS